MVSEKRCTRNSIAALAWNFCTGRCLPTSYSKVEISPIAKTFLKLLEASYWGCAFFVWHRGMIVKVVGSSGSLSEFLACLSYRSANWNYGPEEEDE